MLKSPLRIAWLMPTLSRSFYLQPVLKEFVKRFPDTTLFTGLWPGNLPGYESAFRIQHVAGVRFIRLVSDPLGYGLGFTWAPPTVAGRLVLYRPSVVIVGGFNVWALYCAALKRILRYRVVLLWDGNSPATVFEGSPLRAFVRRWLGRRMDACISNTQAGANYLHRNLGIPVAKIRTSPFQVPAPDVLCMQPEPLEPLAQIRRPMFLYVGRLLKGKGVHKLLQACALLRERGLNEFSLVLVGDGPEEEALRRQARELQIEERLHWMGAREYQQLGSFFSACDVFVLPSLEDCRPMVVSEAMVFGKPILCSRYTDLGELVRHGENGFTMDPQKPEEIAGYMARYIQELELIASHGARSRELIAPNNPSHAADQMADAILQAVGDQA